MKRFLLLSVLLPLAAVAADSTEEAKPVTKVFEQSQPKPLGVLPKGWKLEVLKGHTIKQQPAQLPNGETTTIATAAYVLVPEPGATVFVDPGFEAALGNAQKKTIGAALTAHAEAATTMSNKLDGVIASLKTALDTVPDATAAKPAPRRK